jgi:hypothetical protein
MSDTWTRRRALFGTGTALAALTGGIALGSDNASATVQGEFTIPNGKTVLADTSLKDVLLEVVANWEFSANAPMDGIEVELHVGATPNTLDMVARQTRDDIGTDSLAGETTLTGSIVQASDYSIENFQPSGGELQTNVVAELRFYALRNGDVVAEARQTDTFAVTVVDEELRVNTTLNAQGEVSFKTGD